MQHCKNKCNIASTNAIVQGQMKYYKDKCDIAIKDATLQGRMQHCKDKCNISVELQPNGQEDPPKQESTG